MAASKPIVWKPKKPPGRRSPGGAWRGPRETAKFGRCELEVVTFTVEERAAYSGPTMPQERGAHAEQDGSHFWAVKYRGAVRRGGSAKGTVWSAAEGRERAIDAASTMPACGRSASGGLFGQAPARRATRRRSRRR